MASDDGTYYDKFIHAIDAMAQVLEDDSLVQLYREQCKQMIRAFMHVRDVLGERKYMKTDDRFSSILKELYRQTFEANAVLESCCCKVEVRQDTKTVKYSWLQVAVTQSEEMVFKVIWDELNWCLRLVAKVGDPNEITEEEPRSYSHSTKLTDMDRKLIDADKSDLKRRLEEFLESCLPAGADEESDRKLAVFLKARHINDKEQYIYFANECVPSLMWSRILSDCDLGPCVTAVDWLGVRVARKVFKKNVKSSEDGDQAAVDKPTPFSMEREIMVPLNHPNVVRFITCSDREGDPAILMECVETTLDEYLEQRAKKYAAQRSGMLQDGGKLFSAHLNTLEVVDIMYQIASVMAYLHGNGVAHCDIKPSNLLVNPCKVPGFDGYVQLKIADFGVSKAGLNDTFLRNSSRKSRGTTIYRAPELEGFAENVDMKKGDVFSYAMTCWHILQGKAPSLCMYESRHVREYGTLHEHLLRGTRPVFDPSVTIPDTLAELIKKCWDTNPQNRPTFSEVCIDLQGYKEELLLGVVTVPSKSPGTVLENKTRRRWKVFQSAYKSVKPLAMQILPPQSLCNSKQDEDFIYPGSDFDDRNEEEQTIPTPLNSENDEEQATPARSYSFIRQLRVCGCFSRSEEDFPPDYPGSD